MKATWIKPNLLECKYDTTYEMLDATYRFSHVHEYPEWRKKVFTRDDLDFEYHNTKGDKDWWKLKWGGANLIDVDMQPFIDGKYGELHELEQQVVDLVKDRTEPYGILMISEQAPYCRDHELAHGLFYLNEKYRTKVVRLIQSYEAELKDARECLAEMYDEENMVDELHAYAGVHYQYYFLPLKISVPAKLRRQLVHLFKKEIKREGTE